MRKLHSATVFAAGLLLGLGACGPDETPIARPEVPEWAPNPNAPIPETGYTTGRRDEVIDQPGYYSVEPNYSAIPEESPGAGEGAPPTAQPLSGEPPLQETPVQDPPPNESPR